MSGWKVGPQRNVCPMSASDALLAIARKGDTVGLIYSTSQAGKYAGVIMSWLAQVQEENQRLKKRSPMLANMLLAPKGS